MILSGTNANSFDGSDIPLTNSTISFDLNGVSYKVVDANSILHGSPIGSANETEPWTPIGDFLHSGPAAPEPASMTLVSVGLLSLTISVRRKRS